MIQLFGSLALVLCVAVVYWVRRTRRGRRDLQLKDELLEGKDSEI